MKKIIYILLSVLLLTSCDSTPPEKIVKLDKFFSGNHKLRKFNKGEEIIQTPLTAKYFLFFATAEGSSEQKINYIAFSWQDNTTGEYIFSKVILSDVRVKFHDNLKEPYVTFRYNNSSYLLDTRSYEDVANSSDVIGNLITNVTVHCTEDDYPVNNNINQLE